MKRFTYEVTLYPAERFRQVVYFCTNQGQCGEGEGSDQMNALGELLNERGAEGWELVHVAVGGGGLLAFWKKGIESEELIQMGPRRESPSSNR
jgi:hypothetical protein